MSTASTTMSSLLSAVRRLASRPLLLALSLFSASALQAVPVTQLNVSPGAPHYAGDNLLFSVSSYSTISWPSSAWVTSLTFNWGDGTPAETINGNSASHTFTKIGSFLVTYTGTASESYQTWEFLYSYWTSTGFGRGYYTPVYGWVGHTNNHSISGSGLVNIFAQPEAATGVPEASNSLALFASGLAGLFAVARRARLVALN